MPTALLSGTSVSTGSRTRSAGPLGGRLDQPRAPVPIGYADNFNSVTLNAYWTALGNTTLNGSTISFETIGSGGSYIQHLGLSFRGQAAWAQNVSMPAPGLGSREVFFYIRSSGSEANRFGFFSDGSSIWALDTALSTNRDGPHMTYNATAMKFWRLSEWGGTFFLDFAPDRGDGSPGEWWEFYRSDRPLIDPTNVDMLLGADTWNAETGAFAIFDNFNTFTSAATNPVDAGTLDMAGASDWTGTGAQVVLGGLLDSSGASDWTGTGTALMSGATLLDSSGLADFSGAGARIMAATLDLAGASDWTGTGALTFNGLLDLSALSDFTGAGDTISGLLDLAALSDMTGAGTVLAASGVLDLAGASDWAGAGLLAASSGPLALDGLSNFTGAGVAAYLAGALDLSALADFTGFGDVAGTDVLWTIIAGWPRNAGRLVLTTAVGVQTYGGFLRNAVGVPAATTSAVGATWQSGFLRGPAPAGQGLGPLVVAPGSSGTEVMGFLRDGQGALIVTTATSGIGPDHGFYIDGTGRLAVALNQS